MDIKVYLPARGLVDKPRQTSRAELRMVPALETTGGAATIQNLAVIAGRSNWRPATERDRDELVAHLQSMSFEDDEVGDWLVMVSIGDEQAGGRPPRLPPTRLRWVEAGVTKREAARRGHIEGESVRSRLNLEAPMDVFITTLAGEAGEAEGG